MSQLSKNALLSVFAGLTASSMITQAIAQGANPADQTSVIEELPSVEVTVSTPSPVKKKKPRAPGPATATQSPPPITETPEGNEEFSDATALQSPAPGTLIVIDNAFVPVTVATENDVLASQGANIADTIDKRPGIVGSTFAGGSSRPIIRGLDNYRVRIQENGIGTHDVSALSEDHAVPLDPFAAEQIEVIRGPATLRYGSAAIGGVVAVENSRIPTAIPKNGVSGQIKGGWNSVDEGRDGGFKVTAGANGIALTADGFRRRTEDYDAPGGRQFNTFAEADSFALGASLIGKNGFVGVAITHYESLYGIPGEEAAEARPRIDLEQSRILAKGELRSDTSTIEALRFWFGASDYKHQELVDEGAGFEAGQCFANEQFEGRVEAQHRAFETSLGTVRGAAGLQVVQRDMFGQNLEGGDSLIRPAKTQSFAAYAFEELDLTKRLTVQGAVRIEHSEVDGQARKNPLGIADPIVRQSLSFTPISGSLGLKYQLPLQMVLSLNGQFVERAPADAELFSQGVHEATETFEIGDPNLEKEKASTIELGLRRAAGPFRFDATAYYTRFDGFIFKTLTGEQCDDTIDTCGPIGGGTELDQVVFSQRDAVFYGVELAAQYDVASIWNGVWGVEGQYDYVRARLDGGENVPRTPPQRLGGGLYYHDANWLARVGVLHAFDKSDIGQEEIETPGYTLVSAELSYTGLLPGLDGKAPKFTVGIKGENLANDDVLNHASFKRREEVFLPGASVRVFGSVKLN